MQAPITTTVLALFCAASCTPEPQRAALVADPNLVELDGVVSNSHVLADAPGEVLVRLRISSSELAGRDRPPINLALVIDASGSMEGEPIAGARRAAAGVVDKLRDGDRLSVIAFGSEGRVIVESSELSTLRRAAVLGRIKAIEARGTTGMTAGIDLGLAELSKHQTPDRINRMVILSDGIPNQPAAVDAAVARAKQMTIPVTALGFGLDYDESLLTRIARTTGGGFHYIEEPEQVAAVFVEEVSRMQRVIAQNMVVNLTPGPGVTLAEVYGAEIGRAGPAGAVALGSISQGERRELIVRLATSGRRDGASVELLDARLTFDDAVAGAGQLRREVFLSARSTGDADEVAAGANQEVELSAARALAASATVTAVALARSGQLAQAQQLLETARAAASEALSRFEQDGELTALIKAMDELAKALPTFVTQVAPSPQAVDIQLDDAPAAAESLSPSEARRTINRSHRRAIKTLQGY